MIHIRQLTCIEETKRLAHAASLDGHGVFSATHFVEKNGEMVGYLSIGAIPTVLVWMHTQKTNEFDARRVADYFEQGLAAGGRSAVLVPVPTNSPFYPFMERRGYVNLDTGSMFMKGLV